MATVRWKRTAWTKSSLNAKATIEVRMIATKIPSKPNPEFENQSLLILSRNRFLPSHHYGGVHSRSKLTIVVRKGPSDHILFGLIQGGIFVDKTNRFHQTPF